MCIIIYKLYISMISACITYMVWMMIYRTRMVGCAEVAKTKHVTRHTCGGAAKIPRRLTPVYFDTVLYLYWHCCLCGGKFSNVKINDVFVSSPGPWYKSWIRYKLSRNKCVCTREGVSQKKVNGFLCVLSDSPEGLANRSPFPIKPCLNPEFETE